jgi:hypothetical protein
VSGRTDPAAFPEHYGHFEFRRTSAECCALEQLYPGIRFNRVTVTIFARFYFEHAPDQDYVEVSFNISGTMEDLERHGFWPPSSSITSPVRTSRGYRLWGASYDDGLDKLAALFIPPLLERFKRGAEEARP